MSFRTLDSNLLVSPQIRPAQIAEAKAAGVTTIINNRPDGEEESQPKSAEIEAAAREAGLAYHHIPIRKMPAEEADVAAVRDAIAAAPGAVLAFCKSGTRSTCLWAQTRQAAGEDVEAVKAKAAAAGYDLRPHLG